MPIRVKLSFEPPLPPIRCLYAIKATEVYIKDLKENILDDILYQSLLIKKSVQKINSSLLKLSLDGYELVDNELTKDVIRNDDLISIEYVDKNEIDYINKRKAKILKKPPLLSGTHKKKVVQNIKNIKSSHVYFDEDNNNGTNEISDDEPKMIITYADLHDGQQESRSKRKRRRTRGNRNKNKKINKSNDNEENKIEIFKDKKESDKINKNNRNDIDNEKTNENELKSKQNNEQKKKEIYNDNKENKQNEKIKRTKEDYEKLNPIDSYLEVGKKIAFKTLDMGSGWTPMVSDYKEATVVNYNTSTKEATLKLEPQFISHKGEEYSEIFNNSKNSENDNIEVVVDDVGFANKEEFTINISDLIDAKKLDE
ncbi:hypothetical protein U3516DRAFT_833890 [Neocallimastix sp. 'constans']